MRGSALCSLLVTHKCASDVPNASKSSSTPPEEPLVASASLPSPPEGEVAFDTDWLSLQEHPSPANAAAPTVPARMWRVPGSSAIRWRPSLSSLSFPANESHSEAPLLLHFQMQMEGTGGLTVQIDEFLVLLLKIENFLLEAEHLKFQFPHLFC